LRPKAQLVRPPANAHHTLRNNMSEQYGRVCREEAHAKVHDADWKFQKTIDHNSPASLSSGFTTMYNNTALVLTLMIAFVLPDKLLEVHEQSLWAFVPEPQWHWCPSAATAVNYVHGLAIILMYGFCITGILYTIILVAQITQLPQEGVRKYLTNLTAKYGLTLPISWFLNMTLKCVSGLQILKVSIVCPWLIGILGLLAFATFSCIVFPWVFDPLISPRIVIVAEFDAAMQ